MSGVDCHSNISSFATFKAPGAWNYFDTKLQSPILFDCGWGNGSFMHKRFVDLYYVFTQLKRFEPQRQYELIPTLDEHKSVCGYYVSYSTQNQFLKSFFSPAWSAIGCVNSTARLNTESYYPTYAVAHTTCLYCLKTGRANVFDCFFPLLIYGVIWRCTRRQLIRVYWSIWKHCCIRRKVIPTLLWRCNSHYLHYLMFQLGRKKNIQTVVTPFLKFILTIHLFLRQSCHIHAHHSPSACWQKPFTIQVC